MDKKETRIGNTHAAHETRHLARKMQLVRTGKMNEEELKAYRAKLVCERESLITRLKDSWSHLDGGRVFSFKIPTLTPEAAENYVYPEGLEPMDFLSSTKLEMHYQYGTPAPTNEHLHTASLLLAACIRDLAWAIAEIDAHMSK